MRKRIAFYASLAIVLGFIGYVAAVEDIEDMTKFTAREALNRVMGTDGSTKTTGTLQIGGSDGTNVETLATDSNGYLKILNLSSSTYPNYITSPHIPLQITGLVWGKQSATSNVPLAVDGNGYLKIINLSAETYPNYITSYTGAKLLTHSIIWGKESNTSNVQMAVDKNGYVKTVNLSAETYPNYITSYTGSKLLTHAILWGKESATSNVQLSVDSGGRLQTELAANNVYDLPTTYATGASICASGLISPHGMRVTTITFARTDTPGLTWPVAEQYSINPTVKLYNDVAATAKPFAVLNAPAYGGTASVSFPNGISFSVAVYASIVPETAGSRSGCVMVYGY